MAYTIDECGQIISSGCKKEQSTVGCYNNVAAKKENLEQMITNDIISYLKTYAETIKVIAKNIGIEGVDIKVTKGDEDSYVSQDDKPYKIEIIYPNTPLLNRLDSLETKFLENVFVGLKAVSSSEIEVGEDGRSRVNLFITGDDVILYGAIREYNSKNKPKNGMNI